MVCEISGHKCDGCGDCYDVLIAEMQVETEIEELIVSEGLDVPELAEGFC